MSAFKRFTAADQLDNVLILHPEFTLTSGTAGWRGSPESSGSISLYGGSRRIGSVFSTIEYQSHAPNVGQTGNPTRSLPITASVEFAYVTSDPRPSFSTSRTRLWKEHWDVINRLYQDYACVDADYVTGSYDAYCLFFRPDSKNLVSFIGPLLIGDGETAFTSSMTLESWVKPIVGGQSTQDLTVAAMNGAFRFSVAAGSSNRLVFSSSLGRFTSSLALSDGVWSHVSFLYGSGTGSFRINCLDAGSFPMASINLQNSLTASFTVGGCWSGSILANVESPQFAVGSASGTSFMGMISRTTFWPYRLSDATLSGAMAGYPPPTTGALYFIDMRDGPLKTFGVNEAAATAPAAGSGALNRATMDMANPDDFNQRVLTAYGSLIGFNDRVGPSWHPTDNVKTAWVKNLVGEDVDRDGSLENFFKANEVGDGLGGAAVGIGLNPATKFLAMSIPEAFHGTQVVPGSVRMTCRAYESFGLVRTLVDDGRGGLYLSGSFTSGSSEDYTGVQWNKVGNVFYGEGLVVIKDPSLLDFGRDDGAFVDPNSTLSIRFRGDSRIPVKTLMCRIDHGEFNCTTNPSFYDVDLDGNRYVRHPSGSIRVSTVGIYNSDRELVGVARLADPLRIRARDRLCIKLRLDF